MTVVNVWVGAVTDSSAWVRGHVSATSVRLAVSIDAGLSNPTWFGPVAPTAEGIASLLATGLDPLTHYFYALETDGVLQASLSGQFSTFPTPGTPYSYTFAASSCSGTSGSGYPGTEGLAANRTTNHPVFTTIKERKPLFFAHLGDMHYANPGDGVHVPDASLNTYRSMFDTVMYNERQAELYRNVPLVYMYDDHDYGPNDSDKFAVGRDNCLTVYRERIPHYPLGDVTTTAPAYQSFQVGRVLYIVSDVRSERDSTLATPTMLGSAQKAWMRNLLENPPSGCEFLVWLMPGQWLGGHADTWASFLEERAEVGKMFSDTGWAGRMVCVSGDSHSLAIDSGAGNPDGGFPVCQFSSLDSSFGDPTYQYDQGPTRPGRGQYGTVSVVDDGSRIAVTLSAWAGNELVYDYTTSVTTSEVPMTLNLTYSEDVARVQIEATGLGGHHLQDTFSRVVAEGWGTSESGDVWTVEDAPITSSSFSVTPGYGTVEPVAPTIRTYSTLPEVYEDFDVAARIQPNFGLALGDSIASALVGGYTDENNHYMAQLQFDTDAGLRVGLYTRVDGVFTVLGTADGLTAYTYDATTWFWLRFQKVGTTLNCRVWQNGEVEPATWNCTFTELAPASHPNGLVGTHTNVFANNTNPAPAIRYADFTVTGHITIADTFNRTVALGWGTADTGQTWLDDTYQPNAFDVQYGVGRFIHSDTGMRRFTFAGSYDDHDLYAEITAPDIPTGNSISNGIVTRATDSDNLYLWNLVFQTDGNVQLMVWTRTGGTFTMLDAVILGSYQPGFRWKVRVLAVGSDLRVKAWQATEAEPLNWAGAYINTDHVSGAIGAHSILEGGYTGALPYTTHFDNFSVRYPASTVTVERNVDRAIWETVRGGAEIEVGLTEAISLFDYEFTPNVVNKYRVRTFASTGAAGVVLSGEILTPLSAVWLKSIARPFLNRQVLVTDVQTIERPARSAVFPVSGRSYPIAVSDLRGSRSYALAVMTDNAQDAEDLDMLLASGDVLFLQAAEDSRIPQFYAVCGNSSEQRLWSYGEDVRLWGLPLTEVAPPGADVVGVAATYNGLVNDIGSYSELLTTYATYADVMERVDIPTDVIVP